MVRRIRSGKVVDSGGKGHRSSALGSLADLERVESLLVKHEKTHNADGTSFDEPWKRFVITLVLCVSKRGENGRRQGWTHEGQRTAAVVTR